MARGPHVAIIGDAATNLAVVLHELVTNAGREGFGSHFARASIESQLGGKLRRDWNAGGLAVHLSVPIDRLSP